MDNYLYHFKFMRLLFLLSLFLVLLAGSLSSLQPLCREDERSALLQFKDSFLITKSASNDPSAYPKVASWTPDGEHSDCCLWDGVECSKDTGHVIGLDLNSSYLHGSINSSNSLFRLLQLQRLNLADNQFNDSQIPFGVGNLSRLTYLNLSFSAFYGKIPLEVSHLSKLSSLDLSRNHDLYIEIDLGSLVQNFTNLEELLLSKVNISSTIPESLANLYSLTTLDLLYCSIHGEFPTEIFLLPNLRVLRVSYNPDLSGHLPEFHSSNSLEVLNLKDTNFSGKLPTSIGNLSSLHVLNLMDCRFFGSVPPSLSNLTQLTFLDLSYNTLTGHIPSFLLANLTQLTSLDLSNNQLSGMLEFDMFLLPNLRVLSVSYNPDLSGHLPEFHSSNSLEVLNLKDTNFSGKLPTSIGNLSSLHVLNLMDCHFSGSVPPSLSNLTQLTYLDLSYNTLTGHIPSFLLANLTQLTSLDLSNNQLSGMLEFDMFLKTKSLSVLMLSGNNFTLQTKVNSNDTLPQFHTLALASCNLQKFPDFLRNQNKLSWLELEDNNFRGQIPRWMYNVSIESLRAILLSNNFLRGFEQSPIVLPWSKLEILELMNNKLQGSLPIPQPSIKIYRVQWNSIREVSSLICNLSSLYVLDLSYNYLSGKLHPCLGNFSSLSVLKLQRNYFHGTIPKAWAMGSSLKMIDLSENQFQGQLPRSMANCMMLEYLHVGNNQINDTFPFWLGTLSRLKVLILRSNAFHGAIKRPEIIYTFSELRIIDLSQNNLSGNLPAEYFLHWNAMKVVGANQLEYMEANSSEIGWSSTVQYTVTIINKGIELEYEKILYVFKVIDFSSNIFEGEIPEVVGSLKGLHLLNLSNNNLTGHIPSSLGNLTNIEAMDLSQNKLLGEIPPQLTQLFFLEYFDVSNNNLTGPIPHGNQFDTFQNSSFGGNSGLCGSPLSKKCGDFKYTPTPPPFEENRSSESSFEFGWKVVAIGYGCGFVIGLVIGKIVITRKYDWFVKIFGRM